MSLESYLFKTLIIFRMVKKKYKKEDFDHEFRKFTIQDTNYI